MFKENHLQNNRATPGGTVSTTSYDASVEVGDVGTVILVVFVGERCPKIRH